MPSNQRARKALFQLLPTSVDGPILELGAGFGHLAIPLSKKYPKEQVIAYEISPLPYLTLMLLKFFLRLSNLKVVRQDFFKSSFREAGLCVCYLYPDAMEQLKKKFQVELREGTPILSNTFAIKGWKAERQVEILDLYHSKVFAYQKFS